jgi:hypothetical protein
MLEQVWQNEGGPDGSVLCTNKFGCEHFEKDSYSQMRVYLAVQVVSMSMCHLIQKQAESSKLNAEFYAPLLEIIEKIDHFVDIFNDTVENKQGVEKHCKNLNSPKHMYIDELLATLALFNEWTLEAKEKKNAKLSILYTSFDDLCSMVFSLVGIAQTYLKEDCSCIMVQRCGNTDVLEHCFAHIHQKEWNFNISHGCQAVGQGASNQLHSLGGNDRQECTAGRH